MPKRSEQIIYTVLTHADRVARGLPSNSTGITIEEAHLPAAKAKLQVAMRKPETDARLCRALAATLCECVFRLYLISSPEAVIGHIGEKNRRVGSFQGRIDWFNTHHAAVILTDTFVLASNAWRRWSPDCLRLARLYREDVRRIERVIVAYSARHVEGPKPFSQSIFGPMWPSRRPRFDPPRCQDDAAEEAFENWALGYTRVATSDDGTIESFVVGEPPVKNYVRAWRKWRRARFG